MQRFFFSYLLLSIFINANVFSQKLKKPDKLKLSDFSTASQMEVLYQRTYVYFPFKEDVSSGDLTDKQFKLSFEYILRIFITKATSDTKLPLISSNYNVTPRITSIDYYTLENNKIKKRDVENSLIKVENGGSVFHTNFSPLIKDPVAIIDLSFSIISDNKDSIIILNYDKIPVRNIQITMDIPEIYTYKSLKSTDCFELESLSKQGYVRGYKLASGNASITGKAMADALKNQFPNADYRPVYFKINSNSYTWNNNCSNITTSNPQLLNLFVSRIIELK